MRGINMPFVDDFISNIAEAAGAAVPMPTLPVLKKTLTPEDFQAVEAAVVCEVPSAKERP
jgi:hypothetical protein